MSKILISAIKLLSALTIHTKCIIFYILIKSQIYEFFGMQETQIFINL